MDSYRIDWKQSAGKELKKLPRDVIARILRAIENLASDPRPHGSRKLVGSEHTFRIRQGDYRVVYNIMDSEGVIEIIRVGHRRDIYR